MGRLTNAWAALLGKPWTQPVEIQGTIETMELAPDDRVILMTEKVVSMEQAALMRDQVDEWLAGDKRAAVLSGDFKFVVVRKPVVKDKKSLCGTCPSPTACRAMGCLMPDPRLSAPVPTAPRAALPKVWGVAREADSPNTLCVMFDERPTDDELRELHELLRAHARQ